MASPHVYRIQLGRELRRLRERADVIRDAAAAELECDVSKISKVETGKATMQAAELRALLALYGASVEEREHALALGREARKRTSYRVAHWLRLFISLESAAAEIRTFQSELVPGLLQTEAYARAVTEAANPVASREEIERLVTARMERQGLLTSDDAPRQWFVLNEAVFKRLVGSPEAMAEQMERLLELGRLPSVSIRVLPFAAGAHPAMGSSFVILRLADPDTQTVYLEDMWDADYVDNKQHVRAYVDLFDRLLAQAADEAESVHLIRHELETLT